MKDCWTVLLLLFALSPSALAFSLAGQELLEAANFSSATAQLAEAPAGGQVVEVTFQPAEYPGLSIEFPALGLETDWTKAPAFELELFNPATRPQLVHLRLDSLGPDGKEGWKTFEFYLLPHRLSRIRLATTWTDEAMRWPPMAGEGFIPRQLYGPPIYWQRMIRLVLFLVNPAEPCKLLVEKAGLVEGQAPSWLLDEFGQPSFLPAEVKVESDGQLRLQAEEEARQLAQVMPPSWLDKYGGWAAGPRLEATGRFRTTQYGGRWWLVDPEGRLFWSVGMDVMGLGDTATPLSGREALFKWLPDTDDAAFGPARTAGWGDPNRVSLYTANLIRKYGPEWRESWIRVSLDRLRAWGFNTIGNWSEGDFQTRGRTAYVVALGTPGGVPKVNERMPDPFDPEFAKQLEASLAAQLEELAADPWLLGYFFDNELPWAGWDEAGKLDLAAQVLALPEKSFARRALMRQLFAKYGQDLARLNAAWSTSFASFEAFRQGAPVEARSLPEAAKDDLRVYLLEFARQYFRTVRTVLKRHDPGHLYLGARFAAYSEEAIKAAGEYCDVVSFNPYLYEINPEQARRFYKLAGKPFIGGEFHFGALDSGLAGGLRPVASQPERAQAYAHYVSSAAALPNMVGVHWFEYVDQPLTGRFDGENYNIGFVDVADRPYTELVRAARLVNLAIYDYATGKRKPEPALDWVVQGGL